MIAVFMHKKYINQRGKGKQVSSYVVSRNVFYVVDFDSSRPLGRVWQRPQLGPDGITLHEGDDCGKQPEDGVRSVSRHACRVLETHQQDHFRLEEENEKSRLDFLSCVGGGEGGG